MSEDNAPGKKTPGNQTPSNQTPSKQNQGNQPPSQHTPGPGELSKTAAESKQVGPDTPHGNELDAAHSHLNSLYARPGNSAGGDDFPARVPGSGEEITPGQPVPGTEPPDSEVIARRRGMWGSGEDSGDTSGFGDLQKVYVLPGTTEPPFGGWFDDVADKMAEMVPGFASRVIVHRGEITFFVVREKLLELVKVLRDDPALRFEACTSVSGVHYPDQPQHELHAVYELLSYTHNRRIRLEVELDDADPHVDSVVPVYPMANFHERETWDMFGIIFDGHPGLTRILMPDDWVGHPQRKDYPLGGIPVEFKGAEVPPPDERRRYDQ